MEEIACDKLVSMLPDELRAVYQDYLTGEAAVRTHDLVKAADKLSALIKCMEEKQMQHREFEIAYESTLEKVNEMAKDYPEVEVYLKEFLPSYGEALDTLLGD